MTIEDTDMYEGLTELPYLALNDQVYSVLIRLVIRDFREDWVGLDLLICEAQVLPDSVTVEKFRCIGSEVILAQPIELVEVLELVQGSHVLERVGFRHQLPEINLLSHDRQDGLRQVSYSPVMLLHIRVHLLVDVQLNVLLLRHLDQQVELLEVNLRFDFVLEELGLLDCELVQFAWYEFFDWLELFEFDLNCEAIQVLKEALDSDPNCS
jgi:hypothetical protein